MGDTYLSAGIIPAAARATHVQNPTLAKLSPNEYEYDDHPLTGIRYGQHDHRSSGTSGYVNHRSCEDLRVGERGNRGVGLRSLTETTRDHAGDLAPYNYDDQRRGLLIPPSDHVLPADASSTLFVEGVPSDCSCREAAHIFRHFRGFKEVRLVNKSMEPRNQSQRGAGAEASVNVVVLCFVEFDNPKSAATAMDALQGYRLDQSDRDSPSLKLQFAHPLRNTKRNGSSFARDRGER